MIERAKGILMQKRGLNEEAAFQMLRKMAMDQGIRLAKWRGTCSPPRRSSEWKGRFAFEAHAGGSEGLEKQRLRIGFVPLADCAPLVFAKERGLFRRHGLEVELSREVSWATLRDKVATGALDAAQMLAPHAVRVVAGPRRVGAADSCTGLSLDLDGNAITVSERALPPQDGRRRPRGAAHASGPARPRLREVIEQRPRSGLASAPLRASCLPVRDPRSRAALLARGGWHRSRARRLASRVVPPPSHGAAARGSDSIDGYLRR